MPQTSITPVTDEQLIEQATALLTGNLAAIYAKGEPLENAARLLANRRMLTSDEQRAAERKHDRSAHRVFNHVPVARFNDEQKRAAAYIRDLERANTVLQAQLDTVTGLAAVKKTVKGQQAAEQAKRARTFVEQAKNRHRDSETRSSSYATP